MLIHNKRGILPSHGTQTPTMIVLHDTAGPTLSGAEATLKQRYLGYHYMIDKNGSVYQYALPTQVMWHAYAHNHNTVGISFVGGGVYGEVNKNQIDAVLALITHLTHEAPGIRYITGHKHISKSGKIDPRFPGEPADGVDLAIDREFMEYIADHTRLEFYT